MMNQGVSPTHRWLLWGWCWWWRRPQMGCSNPMANDVSGCGWHAVLETCIIDNHIQWGNKELYSSSILITQYHHDRHRHRHDHWPKWVVDGERYFIGYYWRRCVPTKEQNKTKIVLRSGFGVGGRRWLGNKTIKFIVYRIMNNIKVCWDGVQ